MVASRESFCSLQTTDGPSICIHDDTKIRAEGKGSINLKHGLFINVICVPSLATNLLSVYQMTHTVPPKRVVFGLDLVEILDISFGNIIAKGIEIHSSKAYALSHFMPYSDPIQSQLPFKEEEGINSPLFPFVDKDVLSNFSNLEDEEQDQHDIDLRLNLKRIQFQIQYLFQIRRLNGPKSSL